MYKTVFKLVYFECYSFPIIVMITSTHRIKIHEVSHEFLRIPDFDDESFSKTASEFRLRIA